MTENAMLVRAGWLVTGAFDPVLRDSALHVLDGLITEVGSWRVLRERHPSLPVLGGPDDAVLPGLVNAHHHSNGVSSLQQGVEDDLLEPWLLAALAAYDESGMRVGLAAGFRSTGFLVHGAHDDQRFLAALPAAERALAQRLLPACGDMDEADWLALTSERVTRWHAHARVATWFGPPGPQWVSDQLLRIGDQAACRQWRGAQPQPELEPAAARGHRAAAGPAGDRRDGGSGHGRQHARR